MTRYLPATSREYLAVPARLLLAARPLVDPVALAVLPDDATEPADGDWPALSWLKPGDGSMVPGILAGPGRDLTLPPGTEWALWVREYLPTGDTVTWPWERLRIGPGARP